LPSSAHPRTRKIIFLCSAEIFPGGKNVDILSIVFRFLPIQCKWMFTKRLTVSTLQRKSPCYVNSQKMRFVGNNSKVFCNNPHNGLCADFQSRALLYKEALPAYTKPQNVTLFYLARLVMVSSKQELQMFGNSLRNQN